jgi:hypothetical protein
MCNNPRPDRLPEHTVGGPAPAAEAGPRHDDDDDDDDDDERHHTMFKILGPIGCQSTRSGGRRRLLRLFLGTCAWPGLGVAPATARGGRGGGVSPRER